jgi:hypothetical protein
MRGNIVDHFCGSLHPLFHSGRPFRTKISSPRKLATATKYKVTRFLVQLMTTPTSHIPAYPPTYRRDVVIIGVRKITPSTILHRSAHFATNPRAPSLGHEASKTWPTKDGEGSASSERNGRL